jgi:hypothetical protein
MKYTLLDVSLSAAERLEYLPLLPTVIDPLGGELRASTSEIAAREMTANNGRRNIFAYFKLKKSTWSRQCCFITRLGRVVGEACTDGPQRDP